MANDYIIKIEGSWPSGETEYVIGTEDPQRLPVVSSDDNGDVLTVVDGKWSDAAPGGGGGGSSLPPVTSDDNGDFLGVVGGEWGKGGVCEVNIEYDDVKNVNYIANSQIQAIEERMPPTIVIWGALAIRSSIETIEGVVYFSYISFSETDANVPQYARMAIIRDTENTLTITDPSAIYSDDPNDLPVSFNLMLFSYNSETDRWENSES